MTTSRFLLHSSAFRGDGPIPRCHSGEGEDLSPPLRWGGEPGGTQAFSLILEDPDAPGGVWVHWVLFNIPATAHALPAGLPRRLELADGSRHGRCWGVERCSRIGYYGPLPPPGPTHRYRFTLTALREPLPLLAGASPDTVRRACAVRALDQAQLVGHYRRS